MRLDRPAAPTLNWPCADPSPRRVPMQSLHGTEGWIAGYVLLSVVALAAARVRGGGSRALLALPAAALVGCLVAALAEGAIAPLLAGAAASGSVRAVRTLLAVALLGGTGVAVGVLLTPRGARDGWRRGALIVAGAPPRPSGPTAVRFAGEAVTEADETKHFKLIGTTGTGKSTVIRALLEGARARGDRAIVADAGGAYLAAFHDPARGDAILNPFDARAGRWDPFAELRAPYDADQLARALVAEATGAEQAWRQYARSFLSALLGRLAASGQRDVGELFRLLTAAPAEELRVLLEGTPAQPLLEPGNERMFGSVRAIASAATHALQHVRAQHGTALSVRRWLREGAGFLYLPYAADQVASLQTLVSAWMRLAILEAMSGEGRQQRLWFVVDELDAIGAIDGLKDALARLRKYGGRCVLGFQSIAQVGAVYGAAEAQTIVENCGNTLILRCSAAEHGGTARFAAALIGEREVLRVAPADLGWRARAAPQALLEPALLPAEIEQLPDLRGFVKLASQPHWREVSVPRDGA